MSAEPAWGVDSEHGRLLDVLVCRPDNYRWRATSAISEATLEAGYEFDAELAASQHAALVSAYEDAGVRCHYLDTDPPLPYQVFTRDSSTMGPNGAVVTQPAQWWRRGEYAPVIRFYQEAEIPIRGMITAGSLEGGDVMIVEPGSVLIGAGETRTQEVAANQLAAWFREDGWEARVQPIPGALRPYRRPRRSPRREAGRRLLGGAALFSPRVAPVEGIRPDRGERGAGLHARRQRDFAG